ncbi:14724_t:CDS:2 [Dentiscutata erythropus]|uniref:14724_t:CDS:1 n=1 Tax=Dentiscutata erythropus TaxID=1348616 RepID=A0A9N8Z3E8_9GLOM|nr:14724_t:CDS:2 [Dentiscutata erythropus]
MSENKYQLFWIPFNELRNTQRTEIGPISVPRPLVNSTDLDDEELVNELFENEIKKKSIKLMLWIELGNMSRHDEGHFGTIFKAYWTKTHSNVICKALTNLKDINGKYYAALIHELTMHTRSDLCENIVRFLRVSKEGIANVLPNIGTKTINPEENNNSKTSTEQIQSTGICGSRIQNFSIKDESETNNVLNN